VFQLIRDLTRDRPCDITGISDYAMIDELGGIQWPFPAVETPHLVPQERRLFEDGIYYHPSNEAKIHFSPVTELPEPADVAYPILPLTGRGTSSQWHTQTRTGKSDILKKLYPAGIYVEIHPEDAAERGLANGSRVIVRSRRGELEAEVYQAPTVQHGQIFIPMHYPELNALTHSSFAPHSRQPNYKVCAVALSKKP
jgi:assimilatory nitrate reductase catalytic subunit